MVAETTMTVDEACAALWLDAEQNQIIEQLKLAGRVPENFVISPEVQKALDAIRDEYISVSTCFKYQSADKAELFDSFDRAYREVFFGFLEDGNCNPESVIEGLIREYEGILNDWLADRFQKIATNLDGTALRFRKTKARLSSLIIEKALPKLSPEARELNVLRGVPIADEQSIFLPRKNEETGRYLIAPASENEQIEVSTVVGSAVSTVQQIASCLSGLLLGKAPNGLESVVDLSAELKKFKEQLESLNEVLVPEDRVSWFDLVKAQRLYEFWSSPGESDLRLLNPLHAAPGSVKAAMPFSFDSYLAFSRVFRYLENSIMFAAYHNNPELFSKNLKIFAKEGKRPLLLFVPEDVREIIRRDRVGLGLDIYKANNISDFFRSFGIYRRVIFRLKFHPRIVTKMLTMPGFVNEPTARLYLRMCSHLFAESHFKIIDLVCRRQNSSRYKQCVEDAIADGREVFLDIFRRYDARKNPSFWNYLKSSIRKDVKKRQRGLLPNPPRAKRKSELKEGEESVVKPYLTVSDTDVSKLEIVETSLHGADPETIVESRLEGRQVHEMLDEVDLSPSERKIIDLMYPLDDSKALNANEIYKQKLILKPDGKPYSDKGVRDIQARALKKLSEFCVKDMS